MDLAQKLAKLKAQQQDVEQKMLQEIAREDAVALAVFSRFIAGQPQAVQAMTNSKYAKGLSKRDQTLLSNWVARIDGKVSTPIAAPTAVSSGQTQSGLSTTEKPQVSH